jgi:hypothetical protein
VTFSEIDRFWFGLVVGNGPIWRVLGHGFDVAVIPTFSIKVDISAGVRVSTCSQQ